MALKDLAGSSQDSGAQSPHLGLHCCLEGMAAVVVPTVVARGQKKLTVYANIYSSFIHNHQNLQTTQMFLTWGINKQTGLPTQRNAAKR